jgi:hypothetical protein
MGRTIPKAAPKSTFRRLDKYLYVARTIECPPAAAVAVCVMRNTGRSPRLISRDLDIPITVVNMILRAAEPFLRKRKAKP